jgi:hypothetical protein
MGEVKDSMTPKKDENKSVFKDILGRRGKRQKDQPRDFADNISSAYNEIDKLIAVKETDLLKEKGKEDENSQSIAILKTMRYHIEECVDLAEFYKNR